jgi:hypothetical protein
VEKALLVVGALEFSMLT